MPWNWIRLFWVLLMLSALVACASPQVQPQPTHALMPDSTPSPDPTSTLEPTYTPLPTDTPQPTITLIPTPLPTATLLPPDASLEGILFLDANGSGLQDKASFICPEPEAAPPSLAYFFPDAVGCTAGEMVTVMEPGLADLVLIAAHNGEELTTTSTDDGTYQLVIAGGTAGQNVMLNIQDPNEDNLALALRYINEWNKEFVIPAQNINGIDLPRQNLNNTSVTPLSKGFFAVIGEENETGLMQGYLTLPFAKGTSFFIWNYFDILGNRIFDNENNYFSTQDGVSLDYTGRLSKEGNPYTSSTGVGDSHTGLDFVLNLDTPVLHSGPNANVWYLPTMDDGEKHVHVMYTVDEEQFGINNAHLNEQLVKLNIEVVRGQVVALSGNTGTNNRIGESPLIPQLHWHVGQPLSGNAWKYIDPFRATVNDEVVGMDNYWGSRVSLWTVDNLMFYP